MLEYILPDNEEHWLNLRSKNINSTDVAALFGLSPYCTELELWHRLAGSFTAEFKENDRSMWGKRLQNSIAHGIAYDRAWNVREFKEYAQDTELRMGSSFDFAVTEGVPIKKLDVKKDGDKLLGVEISEKPQPDIAILEIKNVDSLIFKDGWIIDGDNIEAPPHIELQVQHQLALTGLPRAYIGALVGGNRVMIIERIPDEKIIKQIKARIARFWESIISKEPPKPDFEKDAEFIAKLYSFAQPGTCRDGSSDARLTELAGIYRDASQLEKTAGTHKAAAKAEMLTLIGDSEKVLGNGFSISAGVVGPSPMNYIREGYRNFRVFWKKQK